MTNEEKDLLIAYLIDTSEIDPDSDLEEQFQDWYQVLEKRYPERRTTRPFSMPCGCGIPTGVPSRR